MNKKSGTRHPSVASWGSRVVWQTTPQRTQSITAPTAPERKRQRRKQAPRRIQPHRPQLVHYLPRQAPVRTGDPVDSRLTARRLGAFRSLLVAAPDYLTRRGTPQIPVDLMQHACLHYRFPNSGKLEPWALRLPPGEPELPLPTSMVCNNIETRLCFALQGLGIAYLPDFSIREPLASGHLQPILTDYVERSGVFYVLWPASKHPSPKVRALVDFLCARVFPASDA